MTVINWTSPVPAYQVCHHLIHAGLGAAHVCDLEHASPADGELPLLCGVSVRSLVIFTTRLLSDLHPLILNACCLHPGITTINILSSISEHAHACQVRAEGSQWHNLAFKFVVSVNDWCDKHLLCILHPGVLCCRHPPAWEQRLMPSMSSCCTRMSWICGSRRGSQPVGGLRG
jgi:hypothetical protein